MELNKIYNVDCLELMEKIQDDYFDLIITDPPYGKQYARGKHGFGDNPNLCEKFENLKWDKERPRKEFFDEMLRISKKVIICGGNYFTDLIPPSNCWVIWDKKGNKNFDNPFADCELIWTNFNKVVKKFTLIQQGFVNESKDKRVHPTQKPTELGLWLLKRYATKGDKIFDPFAGSGSFLIACKQLGYEFIGCEINKDYCKIINQRLTQKGLLETITPKLSKA